jgi:hypothetical protein
MTPKSSTAEVRLFGSYDDGKAIPDPYYGGIVSGIVSSASTNVNICSSFRMASSRSTSNVFAIPTRSGTISLGRSMSSDVSFNDDYTDSTMYLIILFLRDDVEAPFRSPSCSVQDFHVPLFHSTRSRDRVMSDLKMPTEAIITDYLSPDSGASEMAYGGYLGIRSEPHCLASRGDAELMSNVQPRGEESVGNNLGDRQMCGGSQLTTRPMGRRRFPQERVVAARWVESICAIRSKNEIDERGKTDVANRPREAGNPCRHPV